MIWMSSVAMALLKCWFRVVRIDGRDFMDIGYPQKWLKPDLEIRSCSFPMNEWRAFATIEECRGTDSQFFGKNMFRKSLQHH